MAPRRKRSRTASLPAASSAPPPSTLGEQGGRRGGAMASALGEQGRQRRRDDARKRSGAPRGRPDPSPWGSVVRVGEDAGRRVLLVDGVVQSVLDDAAEAGYWGALVPDVRPERALVLGVGGGTIVRLLHERFGPLPIVAIDDDSNVLAFARRELGERPGLELVEADAFAWVDDAAERGERVDFACVDLFHADTMPPEVTRRPFLRSLKRLLAPRGLAIFNVFADRRTENRVHRIERVFRVLERRRVGDNVVVWCR